MEKIAVLRLIDTIAQQLMPRYQEQELCVHYAWWMLTSITKKNKASLLMEHIIQLNKEEQTELHTWIYKQCKEYIPLPYLLGTVPFVDLELYVEAPILIPRPETEEWVVNLCTQLSRLRDQQLRIADVGTGTGCIALALAQALPKSHITAFDINPQALGLARRNAQHNTITNVTFVLSDLFTQTSEHFDLIVSNPPYITPEEFLTLDNSVTLWEDHQALVADDDGMAIIQRLILESRHHLSAHKELQQQGISNLIIEIGYKQGFDVVQRMQQAGFTNVMINNDLYGNNRVVKGSFDTCGHSSRKSRNM